MYLAVRRVVEGMDELKHVRCDDEHFSITASHGWSLIPTGENIKVRVVASGTESTDVIIESKAKVFINLLAIPQNKTNVQTLTDYIKNRVYKLCSNEEIRLR